MKRKPYNPILAENHICWTETPNLASENSRRTAATGITKFFGEQTSHHPPITAFVIENPVENIMVEANVGFCTHLLLYSLTLALQQPNFMVIQQVWQVVGNRWCLCIILTRHTPFPSACLILWVRITVTYLA